MIHDFTIPTVTVLYKDQPALEVRGLSFNDISFLVHHHREDVNKLFSLWQKFAGKKHFAAIGDAVLIRYGFELLNEAPGILANVIATGADCHDQVARIERLPASLQIDCLRAIGLLTVEDFGGVKKMLEKVWSTLIAYAPEQVRQNAGIGSPTD